MSRHFKLWLLPLVPVVAMIAILALAYERDRPRLSFHPFCGVRFGYRLDVTIEVKGEQYSSAATSELQRNRIRTGGVCVQTVGSILPFRLSDNRRRG